MRNRVTVNVSQSWWSRVIWRASGGGIEQRGEEGKEKYTFTLLDSNWQEGDGDRLERLESSRSSRLSFSPLVFHIFSPSFSSTLQSKEGENRTPVEFLIPFGATLDASWIFLIIFDSLETSAGQKDVFRSIRLTARFLSRDSIDFRFGSFTYDVVSY